MRRADRLFKIIQLLRRRRTVVRAAELAERLDVSPRTIYRDIADLVLSGTPIQGEAGVGYTLQAGYDLPPLMFDETEVEALVLGARIVESFGDEQLGRAARSVIDKVDAVLPKPLCDKLAHSPLFAPNVSIGQSVSGVLGPLRGAVAGSRKVRLRYTAEDGSATERVVWPLGAFFWGRVWTLGAYCEMRVDFRNFRMDRVASFEVLEETYPQQEGRRLEDYMERTRARRVL